MSKFNAKTKTVDELFFSGTCFYVPLYQRMYSWEEKEVKELLSDLKDFIKNKINYDFEENNKTYYMGNIVYKSDLRNDQMILIDGQQRVTTYLLLLKAMRDILETNFSKVINFKLIDKNIEQMIFYKKNENGKPISERIKLSNLDGEENIRKIFFTNRENLKKIKTKELKTSNFYINYEIIYNFLSKEIGNKIDSFYNWLNLLNKIIFVLIEIPDEQDENKIFENINSKGKSLTITDLVKNYLYIYAENVIEDKEKKGKISELFEEKILDQLTVDESISFFRRIIAYKNGKLLEKPDVKGLYDAFKKDILPLDEQSEEEIDKFIVFLEKAFSTYKYIREFINREPRNGYEFTMYIMNDSLIDTYFTLVLKNAMVNADFDENDSYKLIESDEFKNFIFVIEEWYLKTKIVRVGDFVLARKVPLLFLNKNDIELTRDSFLDELSNSKTNSDENQYDLPSDSNIRNDLINKNMKTSIRKHILYKINNFNSEKESNYTNIEKINVEYIMPKIIDDKNCWRNALGENWEEKHEELLDKLGNLTLTGDGSNITNNCFDEEEWDKISKKKNYENSQMKITRELSKYDNFDEDAINKRTKEFTEIFISLFK